MNYSCIKTSDHITVVTNDGESGTVNSDNSRYDEALSAIRDKDLDGFMLIANPVTVLQKYANDRVVIEGGVVIFDGEDMHNTLADRLLEAIQDGFGVEPLANFVCNLSENPSKRAVDELYDFMEANDLALTPDGHFVAYKKINENYMDVHSNTFDNSLGSICEMPRNKVDEDKDRTCSAGLHFCGRSYLSSYPGERTVVVKINPRDVVAIPSDYHNAKGRTCRYEVIGELTNGTNEKGERTEESLEGGIYDKALEYFERGEGKLDGKMTGDNSQVVQYYDTEIAARDAVWAERIGFDFDTRNGKVKFWDFGKLVPQGYRYAMITPLD